MAIGHYSHAKLLSLIRQQAERVQDRNPSQGDITGVVTGNGLTGGGTTGTISLAVDIDGAVDGTNLVLANTDLLLIADASDSNNVKKVKISQITAAAASPAGSNTQVQFNSAGSFGASANFTFDASTNTLTVTKIGSFTATGPIDFDSQYMTNVDINSGYIDGTIIGQYDARAATVSTLKVTDLTEDRIPIVGVGGEVEDSANLTFDGTTLAVDGILSGSGNAEIAGNANVAGALNVSGNVDLDGTINVEGAAIFQSTGDFQGITSTTVSASNTLEAVGATTLGSTLSVSGAVTLAGPSSGSAAGPGSYLAVDANSQLILTASAASAGAAGNPAGANTQLQFNDGGAFGATSSLAFDGTSFTIGSQLVLSGSSGSVAGPNSYLALDSSNKVILTASSGGGDGTIGPAEDGDYTDGLYTDLTDNTLIGVPIDRFNELFKILAPSPAPALSRANYISGDGATAKLSFGTSQAVAGYTSSATTAGFAAVDINGSYSAAISGSNYRIGVLDGTEHVTGTLNFSVGESVSNGNVGYASGAFGNGETGNLKLELNGAVIHTVNLATFSGTGNPNTGSAESLTSNSGFIDVSITASSFDGNGSEWYIFKHRTAKYKVDSGDQKIGWNYARIVHTVGATDYATNYVEWINDPSGSTNDLAIDNPRIESVSLVGSKFLSGVEYNTDATAEYRADIFNLYRNTYPASGTPISFSVTNSTSPSAQSVPSINTGAGEDNTKVLGVTASLDYNGDSLLSGAMTTNISVTHPLKANISSTGSATTGNGFLIDNRTLDSTNLIEYFHDESYRKTSGSYDTQAAVTNASSIWDSENHMTGGGATGHTDGLLFFNQRLYSPIDGDIPNSGDFSSLINVETGQPDYSGVTGTRTFFRVLTNSSGVTKRDFKITSTKVSTTYNNATLGASNVNFYAKIPGTTGWMDISQDFTYGSISDDDGALIAGASNDTDSGNNIHHITFGTASVASNEFVMLKIEADESWASYISQLQFQLGATTNTATEAPALDDIDANDSGVSDAKLSFGSSNNVANYSNATGSSIGLTNFDSNALYSLSGDRRGVFSSKPVLDGELNEDVSSNGNNYPANAFKNAYTGSLVLEVNGIEVHSVDLGSTLDAISSNVNSNGSGFISLSAVDFSTTTDNIPDYTKPHRTGSYKIRGGDQNLGWNYARVIHRIGASDTTTNYVEWVVDTDNNALAESNTTISNFDHLDVYYQSGIGYFASRPSASYTYEASNVYRNVYQNGTAIRFPTTTNCSITNIRQSGSGVTTDSTAAASVSLAALNNTADCEQQDLQVTGTVRFDDLTSISGGLGLFTDHDVAVASRITHPLKSNLNTTSKSKTSFMVYSGSLGSTNEHTNEYFNTETYRIVSGNYATQAEITSSSNIWNSQNHMTASGATGHVDGLVTSNGYLISPLQIGNAGNTQNLADGGRLQAPTSNPDYSSITGTRTIYRRFENNSTNDRSSVTITLYGSGSLVKKATSLGANGNFYVEAKISGKTAWLDVGTAYSSNNPLVDGAGALDGASPGNPAINISTGGTSVVCNFNGESLLGTISGAELMVLKISADAGWDGYLSRIQVAYS